MKTIRLITLFLFSILLMNCRKDDDDNNTPTEQLRLKTFTDGSVETNYSYNANNMLSSWITTGSSVRNVVYDSENRPIQTGRYMYSYNALGRITGIVWTNNPANVYSSFVYNNEGQVVETNLQITSINATRTYEYNGNNQLVSLIEDSSIIVFSRFLLSYDGNGNISQVKKQTSSNDGVTYTDEYTHTYTYDDKKNPGYEVLKTIGVTSNMSHIKLTVQNSAIYDIGNHSDFRPQFYSPNNILTRTTHYGGGETYNYQYVYNEAGLPTSVEITKNDGTKTYQNWIYETVPE